MADARLTTEEARLRLHALGLDEDDAEALFAHFDDAERRGKTGTGTPGSRGSSGNRSTGGRALR